MRNGETRMTLEQFNDELRSHDFMYDMIGNYKDWSFFNKKDMMFRRIMETSDSHKRLYAAWEEHRKYFGPKPQLSDFTE
jgi:hypothetical protein